MLSACDSNTLCEIYTPIFLFLRKKIVVNIANLEQGPVSNKRSGKFTFYSGIRGKTVRKN